VIKENYSKGLVAKSLAAKTEIMKKRIAVEGIKKEIVSLVCQMLERLSYDICYRHESAYRKTDEYVFDLLTEPSDIVKNIVASQPNLTLICNARGYLSFLVTLFKVNRYSIACFNRRWTRTNRRSQKVCPARP